MENSMKDQKQGYGKKPVLQVILIYVVVAVVVYGLVYYFFLSKNTMTAYQQPQTTKSPQSVSPIPSETMAENVVILTADGYSPATLTMKAGTAVTWTNNSGEEATVNSDPHPTHTDYPPLNLGRFAVGESLTLTFDKPGRYGYHNHLKPSEKGTIIVQ